MQRGEAFNGAKLRIRFGEREEALERAGEHIFRLGLFGRAGGTHRAIAGVDDAFERVFLMRGIAFDGFHKVGDQIVAALELHVDVRPSVVTLDFEADQAVVHADEEDNQQSENA